METAARELDECVRDMTDDLTLRLSGALENEDRADILARIQALHGTVVRLSATLMDLVESDDSGEEGGPYHDLRVVARRIDRLAALCRQFVEFEESPERVFWIEFRRSAHGSRYARFVATPLDIRDIMREAVFESFETVVFTSATLTIGESFDFWASRIGLFDSPREADLRQLPSPFDYAECALLAVPRDAPEPSQPQYVEYLTGFLRQVLQVTEGHALVLFTSYDMLSRAFESLQNDLAGAGIPVMRQGQDDRARLLARFNDEPASVLFATESFWQGVDAPGDALKIVVVCRLPFRVPTDPVLTARTEMIEAGGGNAFRDLALPEAVMKLKQGFGRLIRRSTDRGVVLITDVRLLTRPYGDLFRASLPETATSTRSSQGVIEDIERFFYA
jgi:ATP-dependent DNA helicase DinG